MLNIKRLDGSGSVIQTYDVPGEDRWFPIALAANATSFWAGDFNQDNLYRFNIETGAVEAGPIRTTAFGFFLFGICVNGEPLASTRRVDTEPPLLSVPDGVTIDATSAAGAIVAFAASATDNVDPDVPVICTPASGSTFPVGTTTVSCFATDDAGNTASAAFDIVVRPFVVPFAAFVAEVEVEEPGQVEVKAMFRLGAMSDGIQPANETVTLRVGGFEVTIAAGSFVADDKGRFRFKGAVNGINLDGRIRPLAKGGFEFKAGLPREALMPLGTQVEVSLTIGNDTGATTAAVGVE